MLGAAEHAGGLTPVLAALRARDKTAAIVGAVDEWTAAQSHLGRAEPRARCG